MLELWCEEIYVVKPNKITKRQVSIHCAHGSSVTYPLARVKIAIGKFSYEVEAAISNQLPVPVLSDRDVPELLEILQNSKRQNTNLNGLDRENALMATTRSQWKQQIHQDMENIHKDCQAAATTTILPITIDNCLNTGNMNCKSTNEEIPGSSFDDELFKVAKHG